MLIGYTLFDPLVVISGTLLALYFLIKHPVRLLGWLPAALTIYFFIPLITLLTLWQTVPMLLTGRIFLRGRLPIASSARLPFIFFCIALILSFFYAFVVDQDTTRSTIRLVYYAGIIALLSFSYEMARTPHGYLLFLKGLAITGVVLAAYGFYQIIASYTHLPMRAIVRGTGSGGVAYEAGFMRINSFANEPKRLGYVLFVCGLASLFLAQLQQQEIKNKLRWMGCGTLFMSIFTFSGSYFLSVFLFTVCAAVLYPSKSTKYFFVAVLLILLMFAAFPDAGIFEAIQTGYERRNQEIEVGIDGKFVYRQEFYAWDYLDKFPNIAFSGLGLGQYFTSLNRYYGFGVGLNEYGGLIPLNSLFLELLFDFSGVVAVFFYVAILRLIIRLRNAGETYLCLALLFLIMQSFTILTLQFIVMFAGVALARLEALKVRR